MNPLLSRLQPYPFERLRQLFAGVTPNPAYRPISLGIGEPKHPTPEFIKQALVGCAGRPGDLPGDRRRAAAARGVSPAGLQRRYGLMAVDAGHAGAAGQRLARGAVRLRADRDRSRQPNADRGLPQSVLSNLRRRGAAGRRRALLRAQRPGAQLRRRLGQRAGRGLGPHAAAVRLLAGQPDRRRDAAGRMGKAVRAVATATASSSPRDECYSEIYFRDEPPLGGLEAAAQAGPRRFPQPGGLHQPVQAQQRAGHAQRLRRRRRGASSSSSCCIAPTTAAP